MKNNVCVVIPVRNEADTIGFLVEKTRSLTHIKYVFVVDDSTDDTMKEALNAGATVIVGRKAGLGCAIRLGLRRAKEEGFRYCVVMDAGGTHSPYTIPSLVAVARQGYALVIASRFMKGGTPQYGWRTKLSLRAARCVHMVLGINVDDATTGYRCYDLDFFDKRLLNDSQAWGHAIQIELLALCKYRCGKIAEVPSPYLKLTKSSLRGKSFLDAVITMHRMFVYLKLG